MLKKKWGHCMSGLSAAEPVISPAPCVQSHRWDCAAAQPTDAEQALQPTQCLLWVWFTIYLANPPSEIISIIRYIWTSPCLSHWKTVAARAQCCVSQQWAVAAPWSWQTCTLLLHQCPHISLAGFALTSLKITHCIVALVLSGLPSRIPWMLLR